MMPDLNRVHVLFQAALRLDPLERDPYLGAACDEDSDLRQRVAELLDAHDRAGDFLERPIGPVFLRADQARTAADPDLVPESRCGPYKLTRVIAEGGMGTVWLALQESPMRRTVALKVIRPGLDSAAVLARFEAERQALALMDHPNIAKVLDAGTTDHGRPFFAMELVEGVPITWYCRNRGLDLQARLALFVQVCRAVQHAHQKGIIHRDIKPSNVLVALYDGRPVPKVIDFGIAKALNDPPTDFGPVTGYGAVIGTPEYMSPEQAEPGRFDVDTRSDVYSLGVLLYELLTESTPQAWREKPAAGSLAALRRVGDEPLPPSVRAGPMGWGRQLRGDLDWIVLKALEKDRDRRYETADGFAQDVLRHLADEPVLARPPTRAYRLRKFVRKNRGAVVAATVTLLTLLGGIAGTTAGMLRARAAETTAVTARKGEAEQLREATASATAAHKAEAAARASEADATAVLRFVREWVFAAGQPKGWDGGPRPDITLRDAIRAAEPKIADTFADRPLVEASIRDVIGTMDQYLGDAEPAVRQHELVLRIRSERLGPNDWLTSTAKNNLGESYRTAGKFRDAAQMFDDVLPRYRATVGQDAPETLTIMNNLALAYIPLGRSADAIRLLEEVRDRAPAAFGENHPQTLATLNNLGMAYRSERRFDAAARQFDDALRGCRASLVPDHPLTLAVMNNVADSYRSTGRPAEAATLFRDVLKRAEPLFGSDHPNVLAAMFNLGETCRELRRFGEAVEWHEKAIAGRRKKLPRGHYDVFRSMDALGEAYTDAGRGTDAGRLILERLKMVRSDSHVSEPMLAGLLTGAGRQLIRARQFSDAEPLLREALEIRAKTGPGDWPTFNTRSLLGGSLLGQERFADAEMLIVSGYNGMKRQERTIPPASRHLIAEAGRRVADLYGRWGRTAEADRWRNELGLPESLPPPRPAELGRTD